MSLFHDKNLLEQFAKITEQLDKKAQVADPNQPTPQDYQTLQMMLDSIRRPFSPHDFVQDIPNPQEDGDNPQINANIKYKSDQDQTLSNQTSNDNENTQPIALQDIVNQKPFISNSIDFNQFGLFLDKLAEQAKSQPGIMSDIYSAKNAIQQAKSLMKNPSEPIFINVDPMQLEYVVKPNPGQGAAQTIVTFLGYVMQALQTTGACYLGFYDKYKSILEDEKLIDEAAGQIYGDQSVYGHNIATLSRLLQKAQNSLGSR